MRSFQAKLSLLALASALMLFFPEACRLAADGNLPPQQPLARNIINSIFLAALIGYALVFSDRRQAGLSRGWWIQFAVIGLALCAIPPIFSGDLHEYIMRGRILSVYHQNPYATPAIYSHDTFYPLAIWTSVHRIPENYGPLWPLLEAVPTAFLSEHYTAAIFSFKSMLLAFYVASVFIFHRIAKDSFGERAGYWTAFYALCPNMISQFLVDGHNDIVMIALTLAAFAYFLKDRFVPAVICVVCASLVKFTSVILLPYVVVGTMLRRRASVGEAARLAITAAALFAIPSIALYLVFRTPEMFGYMEWCKRWFASNSVPYAVHALGHRIGLPISEAAIRWAFFMFLIANASTAFLWFLLSKREMGERLSRALTWTFLALYMSYSIPFYGHHILWAFPFMVFARLPRPVLWSTLYAAVGLYFYYKRPSVLFLVFLFIYFSVLIVGYLHRQKGSRA